jgi:uncharacterized membrane protein (GlpM family)
MDVIVRFFAAGLAVSLSGLLAKRFGPAVGGMLLSFPFVIGSGLFLVAATEQGDFRETALGALWGLIPLGLCLIVTVVMSRFVSAYVALGLGVAVWVTVALLSQWLR